MKSKALVLGTFALVVIAIGATVILFHRAPDEIERVATYRYPAVILPDVPHDIEVLKKKIGQAPEATDLGILGSLYFAQSRLTGNLSWLEQAEQSAKASLEIMPVRNASAQLLLARIRESRHDFQGAIQIAIEAMKADSSKVSGFSVLANSELAMGNLDDAGRYAESAVDRMPGLESYGLRALVLSAQGRDFEARADFIHALDVEDVGEAQESARIRSLFARFLMRHGDVVHARLLLNEALKTIPRYHLAYDLLGELSARENKNSEAETYYRDAFASSKQLAYLVHLSRLKSTMGQKSVAEEIQAQAEILLRADINKNGVGHRLDLAAILLDRGQPTDLSEGLKLAIEDSTNRHSAAVLSVLARAYLVTGRKNEALRVVRELLRTGVRDVDYFEQAAQIEAAVDNPRQAQIYRDEALRLKMYN